MASGFAQEICATIGRYLPDDGTREQILDQLEPALRAFEAHGDQQALAGLRQQVNAIARALDAGDTEAAASLLGEWGVLASAFGIDPAKLVGSTPGEYTRAHARLADNVEAAVHPAAAS